MPLSLDRVCKPSSSFRRPFCFNSSQMRAFTRSLIAILLPELCGLSKVVFDLQAHVFESFSRTSTDLAKDLEGTTDTCRPKSIGCISTATETLTAPLAVTAAISLALRVMNDDLADPEGGVEGFRPGPCRGGETAAQPQIPWEARLSVACQVDAALVSMLRAAGAGSDLLFQMGEGGGHSRPNHTQRRIFPDGRRGRAQLS